MVIISIFNIKKNINFCIKLKIINKFWTKLKKNSNNKLNFFFFILKSFKNILKIDM